MKDKFLNTASAYHYIYLVTGKTPHGKSQKEVLKMANDLYRKPGESKWEHKKRISKEQLEEKKRRTAKVWKKRKRRTAKVWKKRKRRTAKVWKKRKRKLKGKVVVEGK